MQNELMKSTQNERIKQALDDAGLTVRDAADYLNITPQTIYGWLRDPTINLRSRNLFDLARITRHSPRWIALEEGPRRINDLASTDPEVIYIEATDKAMRPATGAVIAAIQSILTVAKLPIDCLGSNAQLQAALESRTTSKRFDLDHIRKAMLEVLTESRDIHIHLTDDQLAELLIKKLDNWIYLPNSLNQGEIPNTTEENSSTEKL
jgi:transcriptional regulator with XRE-family HTH domain